MAPLKGSKTMNTFHLFTRFALLVCLPIGMLVMLNGNVEAIRSIDIKSDDQNHEPGFSPENHGWLAASQDYFPSNDYLLSTLNELSTQLGLDEDASKWGGYVDADGQGIPTWEMNNVSSPSLDGNSLRCAITGGDPYSNIHCYRNLDAEPTSNFFTLSMSFFYQPASSFNNVGGPSIVQGLEFTMSKWDQGLRYEWALQWNNVNNSCDTGAPDWLYWDPADLCQWIDFGTGYTVAGGQWHPLILNGEILDGQVRYNHFFVDNQEQQLSIPLIASTSDPNVPDKLAVAVQLDGNSTETPYEVFIDDVTLTSWVFGDVPASYWANSFIERLYNAGITGGCSISPLLYCPLNPVTRAQMAIFILRGMHGSTYAPPTATGTVFSDVPVDSFGAAWIEQFALEGITSGCGSGMYCPDANVTRAQMAIFLLKGKHGSSYIPPVATGDFLDVPVGSFAADWIEQLAAEGITSGCGGGNYCPDTNVTRDQMAVFLVRTFNLLKSIK